LNEKIKIKDLPKEERPRERLIRHGANRLANKEFISNSVCVQALGIFLFCHLQKSL